MASLALRLRNITRTFGHVVANRGASLSVSRGEFHAVVGENGAGKSTLLKIAAGLLAPDSGEVWIGGQRLVRANPSGAIALGLGMVQQHFLLIPTFTVAENVVLGAEPRRGPVLDRSAARRRVSELAETFGLRLDPDHRVEDLSVGEQQRVEILEVLYRDAELLILDEPTAVLAPQEVDDLFRVLRALVARGRTVVFVTHKLREVLEISDRVTVMRHGEVVTTLETKDTGIQALAELMVGSELETAELPGIDSASERHGCRASRNGPGTLSQPVLELRDVWVRRKGRVAPVRGVTLDVMGGEIVGIAGVQGNGQSEVIEAAAGLTEYEGSIRLEGRALEGLGPGERLEAGLAHIPEDRQARGLVLEFSVAANLILGAQRHYTRRGSLDSRRIGRNAAEAIERFDIRPPEGGAEARTLSGGNQQKVVVARELRRTPRAILAAQPARGVDIGAMARIHKALLAAAREGTAVLLVSADLAELMALSDRIVVMYRGELVGQVAGEEATEVALGRWMTGGRAAPG